ncbi:hypothetical protein [Diaphorobacter caeni]|uniref:hypothetical protein n=1 Tax=Diaphorobacter caeni TaxID=2784387 RepID=UPI00189057C3|nr:hypothetical protein [Diaphorobacter caeni]MBF5006039.1 hypothetical protein [Diaphorobacter caeni]
MWTNLLDEPMKILGPYEGKPPSLDTFAPHAYSVMLDGVSIEGQFLQLPSNVPSSWQAWDKPRAYAAFHFSSIRNFEARGLLAAGPEDDSLHGRIVGAPADARLICLSEPFIRSETGEVLKYWKKFELRQSAFSLAIEFGNVSIVCGQRALTRLV